MPHCCFTGWAIGARIFGSSPRLRFLWLTLPASAQIDATVKAYRQSFLDPRDPLDAQNADGKKLYATLIEPAEKLIAKNSRVIVLPDGSLNSLNFETLIVPGSQPPGSQTQAAPHYWIEDATIITANSLALLSRSSVAAATEGCAFARSW